MILEEYVVQNLIDFPFLQQNFLVKIILLERLNYLI